MATAVQIRFWLLQHPRAHSLVVTCGKEKTPIACKEQSWAKLATTIEAMGADRIEGLDADGKLLRAVRVADLEEDEDKPQQPSGPQSGVVVGVHDAETVRFEIVARLVAEAYRHSTEVAFSRMVDVVNVMARRGESLERSLATTERLLRRQAEDLLAEAEEKAAAAEADGTSMVKDMIGAAATQFMKSSGPPAPPTNGKGKPHG